MCRTVGVSNGLSHVINVIDIFLFQSFNDVVSHVEKGYRMEPPDSCPDEIFAIMKKCWNIEPRGRPAFDEISHMLSGMSFV